MLLTISKQDLGIDLISFDPCINYKIPWLFKGKLVQSLITKDISFEL